MTDEVQEVPAETAPEQAATAAPESVETAPEQTTEVKAEETKEQKESKTFTQEELDAAIGKRLARERRAWERQQAQQHIEAPKVEPAKLDLSKFQTQEEYDAALQELVTSKAKELVQKQEHQRQTSETLTTYMEREESAYDKYEDYEQVAKSNNHNVTDVMAEAITMSEMGPDIAYYLGLNPAESNKIARMHPLMQAKEIGRIEAKLAAEPPKPTKTSSAPAPIAPVTARSAAAPSYDTTDPRSAKTMSTAEWIAAENKREREKLAARNR